MESETFKLSKAITLTNGQTITELKLKFEALTTADLRAASKIKSLIVDGKSLDVSKTLSILRLDPDFQMAVGFLAAIKGTEGLTQMDFLKIPLTDALLLGEAAADHFFA